MSDRTAQIKEVWRNKPFNEWPSNLDVIRLAYPHRIEGFFQNEVPKFNEDFEFKRIIQHGVDMYGQAVVSYRVVCEGVTVEEVVHPYHRPFRVKPLSD